MARLPFLWALLETEKATLIWRTWADKQARAKAVLCRGTFLAGLEGPLPRTEGPGLPPGRFGLYAKVRGFHREVRASWGVLPTSPH
jgi:hypothetical protein